VKAAILDSINDLVKIKAAPRGLQRRTAPLVPVMHNLGTELHRPRRVKPAVPGRDAEDLTDAVELPEAIDELPDDGVEARAEPPAGDDGGPDGEGVEEDVAAGAGAVVEQVRGMGREGPGEVVDDLSEDDVTGADVESLRGVEEGVLVERVGL
ncbi:hypothetical protein PanWU01x14_172120, partial [Parasponia andersonii]